IAQPVTLDVHTLSLHDALPISFPCFVETFRRIGKCRLVVRTEFYWAAKTSAPPTTARPVSCRRRRCGNASGEGLLASKIADFSRSEEHTSELQSRGHLVCRLLL